jgi:hypothetical protein
MAERQAAPDAKVAAEAEVEVERGGAGDAGNCHNGGGETAENEGGRS